MSDRKKDVAKSIPVWQRGGPQDAPAEDTHHTPEDSVQSTRAIPPPRAILIEQATKFLEDDEIRDASTERKTSFLESKGLTNDEIHRLLGTARDQDDSGEGEPEDEVTKSKSPKRPQKQPELTTSTPPPTPTSSPSQDIPPIITYPEFLLHSQNPPPLITAQRLLTTLYLASGAAATVYGTNKFILNPMLDSLTTARHSLFETASTNLTTLNEKLEEAVTTITIPSTLTNNDPSHDTDYLNTSSPISEDPTSFFHRSTATQTTPHLSPSTSSVSSQDSSPQLLSLTTTQTAYLQSLHSHLSDLLPSDTYGTDPDDVVEERLIDLRAYLDGLVYGGNSHLKQNAGEQGRDEVASVKAEIRGVKGVLLSARNFPSGVGTRGWG